MADIIFPDEQPTAVVGYTMLPRNVDLTFWKGDSQEFILKFNNDEGVPVNLTGHTPSAVMKSSFNSPTAYTFDTSVQNENEIKVYLSSAVSKTIPAGDYIWNLQVTSPDGNVRTYLAGDVVVFAEVDS